MSECSRMRDYYTTEYNNAKAVLVAKLSLENPTRQDLEDAATLVSTMINVLFKLNRNAICEEEPPAA